jgi:multidrug efflux pump subunit AcrA (membrane-fusion protein)
MSRIIKKKRRSRVRPLLFVILLAGAGYGGYRYYQTPAGRQAYGRLITQVAAKARVPLSVGETQTQQVFVPTTTVRSGSFDVSLVAVGALKSKESQTVVVDTFGTVVWTVEDGTRVKKGDPIVELQNDMMVRQLKDRDTALVNAKQKLEDTKRDRTLEWENAVTQYQKGQQELQILQEQNKSALEQADAQLEYQKTDMALAEVQYSRDARLAQEKLKPQTEVDATAAGLKAKQFAYKKAEGDLALKKGQLASDELQKKQEVDRLKFAADMAKGRIDSEVKNAQLNVDTTKKQRQDLLDQLKKSVVTSPTDGIVVLASRREEGSMRPLKPGDQVGRNQQICQIPDLSHMQVTLEVEQKDIGPVRVGLPVKIRLDPFPDRAYHGRVAEVASVAKASQIEGSWWDANKNTFTTLIDIKETDPERLRPGMNATLEIYSSSLKHVTYIPLEAMFRQNDRPVAYLQEGPRFRMIPLAVGAKNKDKIVVSRGLRPGQRIALVPPPNELILNATPTPQHHAPPPAAPVHEAREARLPAK